jgi:hypothetical protein
MTKLILPKWDWNDAEVEARLRQSLESVGVTPVPDEPAWQQVAHEVHRLGPTEERPTAEYARRAGINSIPLWQVPPELGTFHQEDFEFRDGRPRLVDSVDLSMRPDAPEKFIPRTVFECTGIDFEYDDLPEFAAEDYRLRLLIEVAKLVRDFDKLMQKTSGPAYFKDVDFSRKSLIMQSMYEAYRGMDLSSPLLIATDLRETNIEGLPRVGSKLQRVRPRLRLPDCGITAMVDMTEEIQRQLADNPSAPSKPSSGPERFTIYCDLYRDPPQIVLNRNPFKLTKLGCKLFLQLLEAGAKSNYFVSYSQLLESWSPHRPRKDGRPAKAARDDRNKIHAFRGGLNKAIRKKFDMPYDAIVIASASGLALNTSNFIWRPEKYW